VPRDPLVVPLIRGGTNKHEGGSLLCQRYSLIPNSRYNRAGNTRTILF
jgi:hypothetical protein